MKYLITILLLLGSSGFVHAADYSDAEAVGQVGLLSTVVGSTRFAQDQLYTPTKLHGMLITDEHIIRELESLDRQAAFLRTDKATNTSFLSNAIKKKRQQLINQAEFIGGRELVDYSNKFGEIVEKGIDGNIRFEPPKGKKGYFVPPTKAQMNQFVAHRVTLGLLLTDNSLRGKGFRPTAKATAYKGLGGLFKGGIALIGISAAMEYLSKPRLNDTTIDLQNVSTSYDADQNGNTAIN